MSIATSLLAVGLACTASAGGLMPKRNITLNEGQEVYPSLPSSWSSSHYWGTAGETYEYTFFGEQQYREIDSYMPDNASPISDYAHFFRMDNEHDILAIGNADNVSFFLFPFRVSWTLGSEVSGNLVLNYFDWLYVSSDELNSSSLFTDLNTFSKVYSGVLPYYYLACTNIYSEVPGFTPGYTCTVSYRVPFNFGPNSVVSSSLYDFWLGIDDVAPKPNNRFEYSYFTEDYTEVWDYVELDYEDLTSSVALWWTDLVIARNNLTALGSGEYSLGYDQGYLVGLQEGYQSGYRQGQSSVTSDAESVFTLFSAVTSVPFNVLNGLSGLTIWDTSIIALIVTFLFAGLVFWIVRKLI